MRMLYIHCERMDVQTVVGYLQVFDYVQDGDDNGVVSISGFTMFSTLNARKKSDRHDTAFETVVKQWIRLKDLAMVFSVSDSGMEDEGGLKG